MLTTNGQQCYDFCLYSVYKPKNFIELVGTVWNNGFSIKFIENLEGKSGVGLLLLHPDNMPKNE